MLARSALAAAVRCAFQKYQPTPGAPIAKPMLASKLFAAVLPTGAAPAACANAIAFNPYTNRINLTSRMYTTLEMFLIESSRLMLLLPRSK